MSDDFERRPYRLGAGPLLPPSELALEPDANGYGEADLRSCGMGWTPDVSTDRPG